MKSERFVFFAAVLLVAALQLAACGEDGGGNLNGSGNHCGGACSPGTSCNVETGRCECTSSPEDSCAPFGRVCNSRKICVEEKPSEPPEEGARCAGSEEEVVDGLACADPFGSGERRWARICTAGSHCDGLTSACVEDASALEGRSVCWENPCGDDAMEAGEHGASSHRNGENWGRCDVNVGQLDHPDAEASGSCLPHIRNGKTVFLCSVSGSLGDESFCRSEDVTRGDSSDLCEEGLHCFPRFVAPRPCQHDVSGTCLESELCDIGDCVPMPGKICMGICTPKTCEDDQVCGEGAYCDGEACRLYGRCEEPCNGGKLGGEAGELASCEQGAGSVCSGGLPANAIELDHALGYCQHGCDLFGGEAACPDVDGKRHFCVPTPTGEDPLAGTCVQGPAFPDAEGDSCDGPDAVCGPGLSCRQAPDERGRDIYQCLRLCVCEGEGGWDALGRCLTDAPRCDPDQSCIMTQIGNPHLGACLRVDEE